VAGCAAPVNAPNPGAPCGALIGRIGNGTPFVVGNSDYIQVPYYGSGELRLAVNTPYPYGGGSLHATVLRLS
jgi:hypothetical protein